MRITPRITPYVPKPQYFTPGHLIRSAPRAAIARVRVPHAAVPHVAMPRVRAAATTSNLTKQSSSGTRIKNVPSKPQSPKSNRPPKTPKIKVAPTRAGAVKIPSSFSHPSTPSGPHIPTPAKSMRQVKSAIGRSNPAKIKFPNI